MVSEVLFARSDLGHVIELTGLTLTAVSTVVVCVRFACRIWIVGRPKAYDYLIAAAVICTWALCVINHFQIGFGVGTDFSQLALEYMKPNVPKPSMQTALKFMRGAARSWFAYQMVYLLIPALVKLSILVFYLSIATQRYFRAAVYLTMGFVTAFTIVFITINAFECPSKPSHAVSPMIWLLRHNWKCFDLCTLFLLQAAFNLFSDLLILILPLSTLMRLNMPRPQRISVLAVFSAGLLVPIAATFRIWALWQWSKTPGLLSSYYSGYVIFWDQVEVNTAIICASAPSFQPLIKGCLGEIVRYKHRHSAYYYYGDDRDVEHAATTRTAIGQRENANTGTVYQRKFSLGPVTLSVPLSTLQTPSSHGQPDTHKPGASLITETNIRQMQQEEEIRERVKAFSIRSTATSVQSEQQGKPARPKDLLAAD